MCPFFFFLVSVYLDYNATTPLEAEVLQAIHDALQEAWGNPSSSYKEGNDQVCSLVLTWTCTKTPLEAKVQ